MEQGVHMRYSDISIAGDYDAAEITRNTKTLASNTTETLITLETPATLKPPVTLETPATLICSKTIISSH